MRAFIRLYQTLACTDKDGKTDRKDKHEKNSREDKEIKRRKIKYDSKDYE